MKENPSNKDIRKFKVTLLLLPVVPALIFYFKNHLLLAEIILAICWGSLVLLFIPRIFGKNIDKPIYHFYRILLKYLGIVISSIALVVTWFCTILPTGIVAKLMKRDRLSLKKQKVSSYWKEAKPSSDTYENQY